MPRFSSYLLGFRDSYCARSVLLDHLSSDGFDYLSGRLFDRRAAIAQSAY